MHSGGQSCHSILMRFDVAVTLRIAHAASGFAQVVVDLPDSAAKKKKTSLVFSKARFETQQAGAPLSALLPRLLLHRLRCQGAQQSCLSASTLAPNMIEIEDVTDAETTPVEQEKRKEPPAVLHHDEAQASEEAETPSVESPQTDAKEQGATEAELAVSGEADLKACLNMRKVVPNIVELITLNSPFDLVAETDRRGRKMQTSWQQQLQAAKL